MIFLVFLVGAINPSTSNLRIQVWPDSVQSARRLHVLLKWTCTCVYKHFALQLVEITLHDLLRLVACTSQWSCGTIRYPTSCSGHVGRGVGPLLPVPATWVGVPTFCSGRVAWRVGPHFHNVPISIALRNGIGIGLHV